MPGYQLLPFSLRRPLWAVVGLLLTAEAAAQTQQPPRLVPFRQGSRFGYADLSRRLVLPALYDDAGPMVNEVAWVRRGALYGYIDGSGNPVTPVQYAAAGTFGPDGRATVVLAADTFAIGPDGQRLTGPAAPASETDYLEQGDLVRRQGKVGFRFTSGSSTVVPAEYDEIRDLHHDGLLLVRQGTKWGVLNAKGRLTLPLEYDAIRATPANGFVLPVVEQAGRFGYLGPDGKLLTPIKYATAAPFVQDVARVTTATGQPGYLDSRGREFWDDK
ncbi:WG repeat-containing protein [Hymenobacter yonginensis]|uniref:WG repeat-containing protein n=1 Tax=Hymenobacter yonginensis TaxID=748197 RepID=A0ABY7PLI7_9BACT|nr:WG repeat-containing protein [Hymenobacter yonginensis]WBO83877.1 WG repeat-containing protein [Hymenobacter yonginensis]